MINDKYMNLLKNDCKEAYLQYKKSKFSEGLGSHQPVLIHMLNTIVEGSVLEFGVGYHSTPIMNLICGMQGRKLLSIDYDIEWLKKFIMYQNDNHDMFVFDNEKLLNKEYDFFEERFAIAFIDGCPPGDRQTLIKLLEDNVDYFIVHDTEEVGNNIEHPPFRYHYNFSSFKHIFHFRQGQPMTSMLSNLNDIDKNVFYIFE